MQAILDAGPAPLNVEPSPEPSHLPRFEPPEVAPLARSVTRARPRKPARLDLPPTLSLVAVAALYAACWDVVTCPEIAAVELDGSRAAEVLGRVDAALALCGKGARRP